MRVYRVSIEDDGEGGYVNADLGVAMSMAADEIREGEVGDKVTILAEDMSQDDYDNLPEFTGF
jgi:hypothetical protein